LNFYPCQSSATQCSSGNNGNLYSQTIAAPILGTLTQNYSYDPENRLIQATEGSSTLETYSYDGFGNRWVPSHNTSLPPLSLETPMASNDYSTSIPNRIYETDGINPWVYDAAGNVKTVWMNTASGSFSVRTPNPFRASSTAAEKMLSRSWIRNR
jgi:hypothetical protein